MKKSEEFWVAIACMTLGFLVFGIPLIVSAVSHQDLCPDGYQVASGFTCTTAARDGATCQTYVSWTKGFNQNRYHAICSLDREMLSGQAYISEVIMKEAKAVVFEIKNFKPITAQYHYVCVGVPE